MKLVPRTKLWLEVEGAEGQVVLSDWRVRLLEAIDETGSLKRAAERLDVPYKTAWYKLKEVETRTGLRVVETASGGAEGGGSRLTAAGRDLVRRYHAFAAGVADLARAQFRAAFR
jgi:molybdate transport system regulatory protein